MPSSAIRPARRRPTSAPAVGDMERWKLEDAKARLSELVRDAERSGPQLVTVRGKEAAVVIAPEDYRQMLHRRKRQASFADFLRRSRLGELKIDREADPGRSIDL